LAADLAGLRVAITRPAGQAEVLAARIQAVGGEALSLPLLEIAPPTQLVVPHELGEQMACADWVIFISPNALRMALQLLPLQAWPPHPKLAAIGQGTARALRAAGFAHIVAPSEGGDSEALLALPAFQNVAGQRVLLVRGEGGRELLAAGLSKRGALIEHAVVYRRVALPPDFAVLRHHDTMVFVLTSSEAVRVLVGAAHAVGEFDWLRAQDFVFAHPRIAAQSKTLGLNRGMIAQSPEDDAVFSALCQLHHPSETLP
jgi:uroporphyrinogen-III synthase